jgi:hypothetical protein
MGLYITVFADRHVFAYVAKASDARPITDFRVVAYYNVIPNNNVPAELNVGADYYSFSSFWL